MAEKRKVKCSRCGKVTDNFYWYDNYTRKSPYCKPCMKDHRRENLLKKSAEARFNDENRKLFKEGLRRCKVCDEVKELDKFSKINGYYLNTCKECYKEKLKK